jgi:hypothetical protein
MIAFDGPGTLAAKLLMMSSRIALAYYQVFMLQNSGIRMFFLESQKM